MPTGKILVLLDESLASIKTLEFTLKHFNTGTNLITGLKLQKSLAKREFSAVLANGGDDSFNDFQVKPEEELANSIVEIKSILNSRFKLLSIGERDLSSLHQQSRYADLLVTTQSNYCEFVQPMINNHRSSGARVPISCLYIIVPDGVVDVERIILLNDNSEESLHSMKGFCRLFSDVCKSSDVTLMNYIDNDLSEEENSVELKLLATYLRAHCNTLAIHRYQGEEGPFLSKLLSVNEKSLVVKSADLSVRDDQAFFNKSQVLTIGGMI